MNSESGEMVVVDAGFDGGPEVTCCTASFNFIF